MSIKKFLSLSIGILLLFTIAAEAQIPDGYYDAADGKTGSELKAALNTIVNTGLNRVSYGDSRNILDKTDQDPDNLDNIILVYRGTSVSGDWDEGTTWNREHVWPQSLLGLEDLRNTDKNVGTDLHNLKPANPSENSSRSNKYYDNQTTSASYAPRDAVKGDLARILFYMVIAYETYPLDLELVNHEPNLYQMAMLDVLLEWHEQDPVDSFEENRNEIIYSYQHNRNPFIDHPEYVALIWSENPPPQPPSDLVALDAAQTSLLLRWTDNSAEENGFIIYQNSVRIDSVAADSTSYQVINLLPGTLYCFAVTAYNNYGESAAAVLEVTTLPGDSSQTTPDSLFFSEYIEGNGFNKALEIYNASGRSVNLSGYSILANSNNSPWYQTHYSFPAGAVLEPGSVWVIMNSGFDSTYHSVADELTSATVVNFNGNDVRALVKFNAADTTFLDVIGVYGDTAEVAAWSVAGITGATENHTLVRKPSVKCGNPDWYSSAGTDSLDSEWLVYAGDTFDFLGYHTVDTVSAIDICNVAPAVEYFRLYSCYPNPFNPTTKIRYDLETIATVTLQIFDLRGVLVKTLVHTRQQPGHYRVAWDARDQQQRSVPAGVYLYRLQTADGFGQTGKMMYLK
ncbi:MAG: endonuclease [Fidelibacterota bacterium]